MLCGVCFLKSVCALLTRILNIPRSGELAGSVESFIANNKRQTGLIDFPFYRESVVENVSSDIFVCV